jgi:hypothetical protein
LNEFAPPRQLNRWATSLSLNMKPQRIHRIAAIVPSLVVSLVHFKLSVLLAPHANVVFQRRFDTGALPTGADAIIYEVNTVLSRPIPALLFAGHPVYGLLRDWWYATIANSIIWGLTLYALYLLVAWVLDRITRRAS